VLLVALAWIGFLHLTRRTAVRHVHGVAMEGNPVASPMPRFRVPSPCWRARCARRAIASRLYTAPTLGSTPAERFLALSLAAARNALYVTNAYFAPDGNFVGLLSAAARRGVDVRILTAGPVPTSTSCVWPDAAVRRAAHGVRIYDGDRRRCTQDLRRATSRFEAGRSCYEPRES
jgi:hypothetical protein